MNRHCLDIRLTLSGGGKRAVLFHLGVIRFLSERGIFDNIRAITSVSGGSIIGAHVVLHWNDYRAAKIAEGDRDPFFCRAQQIIQFCRDPTRELILSRVPYRWVRHLVTPRRRIFDWSALGQLSAVYDRLLFSGAKLGDLSVHGGDATAPKLMILCTNVTKMAAAFFDNRGCHPSWHADDRGRLKGVSCPDFSLSRAVAASSAFPGLFGALELDADSLATTTERLGFETQSLSDGGIFDNLGIRALELLGEDQLMKRVADFVIVSDAGRISDWQSRVPFPVAVNMPIRGNDVLMSRVAQAERERAETRYARDRLFFLQIHGDNEDRISRGDPHTLLHLSGILGKIRTDMDSFSDLEITAITQYGYEVAQSVLSDRLANSGADYAILEPWNPITGKHERVTIDSAACKSLQKSAERPIHFLRMMFDARSLAPFVIILIVLVVCFYYIDDHVRNITMKNELAQNMNHARSIAEGHAALLRDVLRWRTGSHGFPGTSIDFHETWSTSQAISALCCGAVVDSKHLGQYVEMLEARFSAYDFRVSKGGWTSDSFGGLSDGKSTNKGRVHAIPAFWTMIAICAAKGQDDKTSARAFQGRLLRLYGDTNSIVRGFDTDDFAWSFYPATEKSGPHVFATCYGVIAILYGLDCGLYYSGTPSADMERLQRAVTWLCSHRSKIGDGWSENGAIENRPILGLTLQVSYVLLMARNAGASVDEPTMKVIESVTRQLCESPALDLSLVDSAQYDGSTAHFARYPWGLSTMALNIVLLTESQRLEETKIQLSELSNLLARVRIPTIHDASNTYRFALALFSMHGVIDALERVSGDVH